MNKLKMAFKSKAVSFRKPLLTSLLGAMLSTFWSASILADEPTATCPGSDFENANATVTITNPLSGNGGTVYLDNPDTDTVNIGVALHATANLKNIDLFTLSVSKNGSPTSLIDDNSPFDTNNNCSMSEATTCTPTDDKNATVTKTWTPGGVGTYLIDAYMSTQAFDACDQEEVIIEPQIISVEFPAPPAIANHYINEQYPSGLSPKCRGRIIRAIADKWNSDRAGTYGPAPGPYDSDEVGQDVVTFNTQFSECRK